MSPRPSPCDGFSGALPAYVDHELPEEQGSSVESHLEGCPRCQARLRELESVSSVLKAWDAQVPAGPPAPQRLERAVLARVQAASAQRQADRLRTRLTALALAAAVLVAVGVPLALGLAKRAEVEPYPAFERMVATAPHVDPGAPPAAPRTVPTPAELLAHAPWSAPSVPPGQVSDEAAREAFLAGALPAQQELELEREFTLRVHERGVWVTDVQGGTTRRLLVTPRAAEAFGADELLDWLRMKAAEPYYDPTEARPRSLGLSAGDLLAEPLGDGTTRRPLREELPLYSLGKPGTPKHALDVWPLAPRSAAAPSGPEVLDPLEAQARLRLRLEPSAHDKAVLLAVVEGTTLPILIPAGQLVTGGETDLVVARATWLPASSRQDVWMVPAVEVRSGPRREAGAARLTPFVAGPSLRALLLAGADAEVVRTHARNLVAATLGGNAPPEWSLLDLYDGATDGLVLAQLVDVVRQAPHGLILGDDQGRFVGLEHLTVRGEGATPLLARLLHGYVWEARRRASSSVSSPPPAKTESVDQELARLRNDRVMLLEQPARAAAAVPGVSRATGTEATRAVEALRVKGQRVSVSLIPR